MDYLLIEQTTAHLFGQFASRDAALDEVIEMIRQGGPGVTENLGLVRFDPRPPRIRGVG